MTDYQELGKRIRAIRKVRGWTQEQLAKQMGFTASYIGKVEHGKEKLNLNRLTELCDVMGVSSDALLYGQPSCDCVGPTCPKKCLRAELISTLQEGGPALQDAVLTTLQLAMKVKCSRN